VFKARTIEAQEFCLAAGVLVGQGWLSMVVVLGRIKGFVRTYPKEAVPAPPENVLMFPQLGNCERRSARAAPAEAIPLRMR
jgi:hypothetical protein